MRALPGFRRQAAAEEGFTAVERLVVLALLGALLALGLVIIPRAIESADASACNHARQELQRAVDEHRSSHGGPPESLGAVEDLDQRAVDGNRLARVGYTLTYDPVSGSVGACNTDG